MQIAYGFEESIFWYITCRLLLQGRGISQAETILKAGGKYAEPGLFCYTFAFRKSIIEACSYIEGNILEGCFFLK
jgi:hypothetical protein